MSELCLASFPGGAVHCLIEGKMFRIGRDSKCEIVVSDRAISRAHCHVSSSDGKLWLKDLGSSNGTWVNGEQITTTVLKTGDVMRVGNARFMVGTVDDYLNLGDADSIGPADTMRLSPNAIRPATDQLIGGRSLAAIRQAIVMVAQSNSSCLVLGESGTGKELVARAIHDNSAVSAKPFIACNCAAFASELMESQIFGHTKGAFTGASDDYRGVFAQAEGGTLFLDEISEMPMTLQAKLLRAVENREYQPLGCETARKADVRILSASNRDLHKEIARKRFREDLYYRLQVIEILLPPLRERKEDIEPLVQFFLERICEQMKRSVPHLEPAVFDKLRQYHWPGNVRELRNYVERLLALCPASLVRAHQIKLPNAEQNSGRDESGQPRLLADVERQHIMQTMKVAKGNKALAAKMLGIDRMTLYRKLRNFEIEEDENTVTAL